MDKEKTLEKAKKLMEIDTVPLTFNTWIKNLDIENIDDEKIILKVGSQIQKDYLEVRLLDYLKRSFEEVTGKKYEIEISLK